MIYIQRLMHGDSTLFMKGKGFYFDLLNEFKREVPFRMVNVEPVQIISFLTQGNVVEVGYTDKLGNISNRVTIHTNELLETLSRLKEDRRYIVTLTKTVRVGTVVSKQYIVVYGLSKQ
ncbi:hypothetical protein P9X10_00675 [Bacillus cereus]|nr:hypothetical protein [Bacillus cereus]